MPAISSLEADQLRGGGVFAERNFILLSAISPPIPAFPHEGGRRKTFGLCPGSSLEAPYSADLRFYRNELWLGRNSGGGRNAVIFPFWTPAFAGVTASSPEFPWNREFAFAVIPDGILYSLPDHQL